MPVKIIRSLTSVCADALVDAWYTQTDKGGICGDGPDAVGRDCGFIKDCENNNGLTLYTSYLYWHGGANGEEDALRSCYRDIFKTVLEKGLETVALPLLAGDAADYPDGLAQRVASEEIGSFLSKNDVTVYLALGQWMIGKLRNDSLRQVNEYVNRRYSDYTGRYESIAPQAGKTCPYPSEETLRKIAAKRKLAELLQKRSATFTEMLLRMIDRKKLTDAEVYKRANIDRRLFSKIRSNRDYKPSKNTALALAIALELNLDETTDLLRTAGYALSPASRFDLIVEYYIRERQYDIFEINEVLFIMGESQLGV